MALTQKVTFKKLNGKGIPSGDILSLEKALKSEQIKHRETIVNINELRTNHAWSGLGGAGSLGGAISQAEVLVCNSCGAKFAGSAHAIVRRNARMRSTPRH